MTATRKTNPEGSALLTPSKLNRLPKDEIVALAEGYCLLEHLDSAEVAAMTKKALLAEVSGALLRVSVMADVNGTSTEAFLGIEEPAAPAKAEKAPRKSLPASERRTEATHPDGLAAVLHGPCAKCSAKKGERCFATSGARTNYVHGPRFKAWETAGSVPAPAGSTPTDEAFKPKAPKAEKAPKVRVTRARRGHEDAMVEPAAPAKAPRKPRTLKVVK